MCLILSSDTFEIFSFLSKRFQVSIPSQLRLSVSLECRLVTTNLLPGVRLRLLIGLWMMFYCFKLPSRRISWFFCSPGFQKSGYKLHINHKGGTLNSLNISEMSLMILVCMHVFLLASSLGQKGIFLGTIILIFFAYISKREFLLKWKLL